MVTRIWLPFAVAIGALTLALLIIFLMPESLSREQDPQLIDGQNAADSDTPTDFGEETPQSPGRLLNRSHDRLPDTDTDPKKQTWWEDIVILLRMPGLPFCYILFFFRPLAMISKAFVYQYASYNFGWGLSQTTWLRFAQAGGSSLATVAVLPLLSAALNKRGLQAQILDLNVIRASLLIAVVGFMLLQLSYHSWMLLFGEQWLFWYATRRQLTFSSFIRMWLEWGCRARSSGAGYVSDRPFLPRKIVHFGRCRGDLGEARWWSSDGEAVLH